MINYSTRPIGQEKVSAISDDGIPCKLVTPRAQVDYAEWQKAKEEKIFMKLRYVQMLNIAMVSRDPMLATIAELLYQQFRSYDKSKPVELSNKIYKQLGFDHHSKRRSLDCLQKIGAVSVEWKGNQTPSVTILDL